MYVFATTIVCDTSKVTFTATACQNEQHSDMVSVSKSTLYIGNESQVTGCIADSHAIVTFVIDFTL